MCTLIAITSQGVIGWTRMETPTISGILNRIQIGITVPLGRAGGLSRCNINSPPRQRSGTKAKCIRTRRELSTRSPFKERRELALALGMPKAQTCRARERGVYIFLATCYLPMEPRSQTVTGPTAMAISADLGWIHSVERCLLHKRFTTRTV